MNCGNTYSRDMIEQERSGCNPYPITSADKTVIEDEITIPASFFDEKADMFTNWKNF